MPRYYLHIRDGGELIVDPDGSDLPDLDAARAEALAGARDILATLLKAGKVLDGQQIEVTDDENVVRAIVPLRDAIRLS